jgi:WD40 repeat protein
MACKQQYIYAPLPQMKRGAPMFPGYDAKSGNLLYTCGSAVVIRNVANPLAADMYYEHTCQTTVAKYSPSGFYIASGDIQGNLRIWDTTQKEHPLKIELKVLPSPALALSRFRSRALLPRK